MKHAVITRLHYKNDQDLYNRLDYYKKEVFPRLLKQNNQNFDIWLWVEPKHEKIVKFHPRINTFTVDCEVRKNKYGHFIDHSPWSKVNGLPQYDIQTGLDSDDLVVPDFIEKTQKLCKGKKSILISYQPIKLDIKTGKKYHITFCGNKTEYNEKNGTSPVFSIYQPNKEDFKFAYEYDHLILHRYFDKTILLDGMVLMSVHDNNDSTRIKPTERLYAEQDLVYVYKKEKVDTIKYSLHTTKNIPHRKIFIIGDDPEVDEIEYTVIPCEDNLSPRRLNIKKKLLKVIKDKRISKDFILMNDDFYILKPISLKYCHLGKLEKWARKDRCGAFKTFDWIETINEMWDIFPDGDFYEVHYPVLFNKTKLKKAIGELPDKLVHMIRTYYCNKYKIKGDLVDDFKVYDLTELKEGYFISSSPGIEKEKRFIDFIENNVFGKVNKSKTPGRKFKLVDGKIVPK